MKKISWSVALCAALLLARPAAAQIVTCPIVDPALTWTATWTDSFSQTTYTLEAPCKVFLDEAFTITATVTDPAYPESMVGGAWTIVDNGAVVRSGGYVWMTGGVWQSSFQQTYTGVAVDHTIEFRFKDFGQGSSGHSWSGGVMGGFTVDPVRPPPASAPRVVAAELAPVEAGGDAVLLGSVSDADGGVLAYRWLDGEVVLAEGSVVAPDGGAEVALPEHAVPGLAVGAHALTLEVSDGVHVATAAAALDVVDTTPPALAPTATPALIWPPDGRIVEVTVAANATDAGGPVSLVAEVSADGSSALERRRRAGPDAAVLAVDDAAGTVLVAVRAVTTRARERTVLVTVTATDLSGNSASAVVPVVVAPPRPQRPLRW
jgi:hypothetical protein